MDVLAFLLLLVGHAGCAFVDQSDGGSLVVLDGRPIEVDAEAPEGAVWCEDGLHRQTARARRPRPDLPRHSTLTSLKR